MNLLTNQKQTQNELTVARGMMGRRASQGVQNGRAHTAIPKMDNHQGGTVQHMELRSMFHGNLDGRGVWGRMDTHI